MNYTNLEVSVITALSAICEDSIIISYQIWGKNNTEVPCISYNREPTDFSKFILDLFLDLFKTIFGDI